MIMSEGSSKGTLPYGWVVKTSTRYPDRVYYFNISTGSSTWDCPELDPPRVVSKKSQDVEEAITRSDEVHEEYQKENVMTSTKLTNKHSPFFKESIKFHSPPTAVVTPVVHIDETSEPSLLVKTSNSLELPVNDLAENKSDATLLKQKKNLHELNSNISSHLTVNKSSENREVEISVKQKSSELDINLSGKVKKKRSLKTKKPSLLVKTSNSLNSSVNDFSDLTVSKSGEKKEVDIFVKLQGSELDSTALAKVKKKKSLKTKKKKKKRLDLDKTDSELKRHQKAKQKKLLKRSSNCQRRLFDDDVTKIPQKNMFESFTENKKDEKIEMLDVSMDIMKNPTAKEDAEADKLSSYYIVVDTNVLISELRLISELKETPVNGCGPPHIFIPWVVIEELDGIKRYRNAKMNAVRAATEAVRFLNSMLGKHPRIHGQSPEEAEEWAKVYSRCNDDRILECCVGLAAKMSQEKVILLTHDKNLVNKALICKINVHNWTSLKESLKPDVIFDFSFGKNKNSKRGASKKESAGKVSEASKEAEKKRRKLQSEQDKYSQERCTVMCTVHQLLQTTLAQLLENEMEKVYGPTWVFFPIHREVLDGMLDAIIRFWGVVFSKFFNKRDKNNFVFLYAKATQPKGFMADLEESLDIFSAIQDVFKKIKNNCRGIEPPIKRLQEFRATYLNAFSCYREAENAFKEAENVATLELFEKNWCAIQQLCGVICDFCGIEHDFEYDKPNEMPSEEEFRRLIDNLYPGVEQLKSYMVIILESIQENNVNKDAIQNFRSGLLKFIPSLEIPHEPVTYPHLSKEALERFCYCPENKTMMEIGCKQIEKFYSKVDLALAFLASPQFKKRRTSTQ